MIEILLGVLLALTLLNILLVSACYKVIKAVSALFTVSLTLQKASTESVKDVVVAIERAIDTGIERARQQTYQ